MAGRRGNGKSRSGGANGANAARAFIHAAPHRVGVLIYPGASAYDVAGAAEVFSTANGQVRRELGVSHDVYALEVIAPGSGPVPMEIGLKMVPDRAIGGADDAHYDTLLISGSCWEPLEAALRDAALVDWLKRVAPRTPRIASMCTGAFLLAQAGVLQRRATTHWAQCERFRQMFPDIELHPDSIYVRDGNVYSSAGSTAAMDLALALVEENLGRKLAMNVARRLVMFLRRPGGQSQFSAALLAQSVAPESLNGVPEWILEHLSGDLSVDKLAARAAMSPRNFARVFVAETGLSPAKYVERARVERARLLIEETQLPMTTIAGKAGFESDRQLRRAFLRELKVSPSDYAGRFREGVTESPRGASRPQGSGSWLP